MIDCDLNSSSARRFWELALVSRACATSRSAWACATAFRGMRGSTRTSRSPRLTDLPGLHGKIEDLTRRLGLHLDGGVGLDRAGGLGGHDDVAVFHRQRLVGTAAALPSCRLPAGSSQNELSS